MHKINVGNKHWYLLWIYWTTIFRFTFIISYSLTDVSKKDYQKRVNVWTFCFCLIKVRQENVLSNRKCYRNFSLKNSERKRQRKLYKLVEIQKWTPKLKILEIINSTLKQTAIIYWESFNTCDCHILLGQLRAVLQHFTPIIGSW